MQCYTRDRPSDVVPVRSFRDARYHANPEVFDPERWRPEAKAALPRFAYFPFGGGARQCIGDGFAWTEGILLVAALARRWSMRFAEEHAIVPNPVITLRSRYGMRMHLSLRRGA